jgi:hypothetical protein
MTLSQSRLPIQAIIGLAIFLLQMPGRAQETIRVSVDSLGVESDANSLCPSISANGQAVAFSSLASNFVPGDTNGSYDIFLRDMASSTTTLISRGTTGSPADSSSFSPSVSADAHIVAFASFATDLISVDTNGLLDVFVFDATITTITRVSVGPMGLQGNGESGAPAISANGRYVLFQSAASNLVSDDTNNKYDVFVHDRVTGVTTRASMAPGGSEGNGDSFAGAISADGAVVAFYSYASNLVSGDSNGVSDVFVRDMVTGVTKRVSVASSGAQGRFGSLFASLSADGQIVAFRSDASNLVLGDTNGSADIFVHDIASVASHAF